MSESEFTTLKAPGTAPKITSIYDFSAEALGQLKFWLEQAGLNLPISQIIGFSQFAAQTSTVSATVTTTSSTFTALTGGPLLTGLPDGKYVFLFGAAAAGNPGVSSADLKVYVNTVAVGDAAGTQVAQFNSVMSAGVSTLSAGGSNTLEVRYRSSDNATTCSFANRFLIALRYANP